MTTPVIVTVTLNPSVDRTVRVPKLTPGSVHVTTLVREDAGGKGVNVSRALGTQGHRSHAIVVAGGDRAQWLEASLQASGAAVTRVAIAEQMRTNLTVVDDDGQVTKLNEPGPVIDVSVLKVVEAHVIDVLATAAGSWLVLAGRLPQGLPADSYDRLISAAHAAGARVAVDADGATLASAIAQHPDLIKPNIHELIGLVGEPLRSFGDVIDACEQLLGAGVGAVLCSLGSDGAFFSNGVDTIHAAPAEPVAGTPVGAGDVLLAGFLASGANPDALPEAIRWSAASVRLPGTGVPTPNQSQVEEVSVSTPVDRDRLIKEVA